MENIGTLAIFLAFCFAIYAAAGSVIGKWAKRPFLILSAERAVYCVWGLVTAASGMLVYSLMSGDFRLAYVAAHSNRAMPFIYKFAPGGAARKARCCSGAGCSPLTPSVVVFTNRRKHPRHDAVRDRRC